MTGIAEWGGLLGALVAFFALAGGFSYWLIRNAIVVATKDYVDSQVDTSVEPVRDTLEEAVDDVERNRREMQALHDLLQGGSSDFEKGMMDFLEENIDRTVEIQDDLGAIADALDTLEGKVAEKADDADVVKQEDLDN